MPRYVCKNSNYIHSLQKTIGQNVDFTIDYMAQTNYGKPGFFSIGQWGLLHNNH